MGFIGVFVALIGALFVALSTGPFAYVFLIICTCLVCYEYGALYHDKSRERLIQNLQSRRPGTLYRKSVIGILRWIQTALRPRSIERRPWPSTGWSKRLDWLIDSLVPTEARAKQDAKASFGWPVLDFALKVAVAYPIVLAAVLWISGGGRAVSLAGVPLFPADVPVLLRILFGVSLTLLVTRRLIVKWASIFVKGDVSQFSQRLDWAILAGALTGAVALAGAGAVLVALAVAGALTGSGAVAGALTGAVLVALAGAVLVALAVVGAACYFLRRGKALIGYGILLTASLSLGLVLVSILPIDRPTVSNALLVFLLFLPLINAIFDYLSYGFTITLIRCGLFGGRRWGFLFGLIDLIAAFVFFSLLIAGLVTCFSLLNRLGAVPLIPLQPIFDGLRNGDANYNWIYFMVFSTFLPTVLHLCIASFSLRALAGTGIQRFLIKQIDNFDHSVNAKVLATCGLSLLHGFFLMIVPVVLLSIGYGLWTISPVVGELYMQIFEWIALRFGEIEKLGPGPLPDLLPQVFDV